MRNKVIIGFLLLGALAYGEPKLGNDIAQNKIIIDQLKGENLELRLKLEELKAYYKKLEDEMVFETNFEKLGITIIRSKKTLSIDINNPDLSNGNYNTVLDELLIPINYMEDTPIVISGTTKNVEYLKEYFMNKGVEEEQMEIKDITDTVDGENNSIKTTILFNNNEK